jgi:diguanylate cyclase (GGDEF)-like protein
LSFRRRLTVFFVLIVIIPMVSVAVVLFRLISDSENGKADARVATQQQVAINLFRQQRRLALRRLDEVGSDRVLAQALQARDHSRASKRARQLVRFRHLARIVVVEGGRPTLDAGDRDAIAPAGRPLRDRTGASFGRLEVSVLDAGAYARRVRELTTQDVVVSVGERKLAGTVMGIETDVLPRLGTISIGGEDYRVASFDTPGFAGQRVRISTLRPESELSDDVAGSRLTAGGLLLAFFILAVFLALYISRSLQQQIAGFLVAARRLGEGDFSANVPTAGHDEFAELGEEFNKMSRQLEQRLSELRLERERVQGSMRRLGEAVASNLDRDALLEIVVRTAVEGVGAEAGRASVCAADGVTLQERSRVGAVDALRPALDQAELDALRTGGPWQSDSVDGAHALSYALRGSEGGEDLVGVVSVGRRDRSFTRSERELFDYLAAQAAVSMENVDLHETVARESVTDELTGLSNRRAFDEAMTREVERSKRFVSPLGLVLFDLDNFKSVNDTYGHQQGDVVLREVARVLRETSREIDVPARYGGEELAVVLPGTDLEGAYNLAERVREGVEALRIPLLLEHGTLRLTTSAGVASLPETADDEEALLAAADTALYDAKRNGKNRSVRAA